MESQGDAPQNVQVHPNNEFLQYMQINADFMNGLSRQLDTSDVVSRIHNFSGNNPSSFRLWMKHLRREGGFGKTTCRRPVYAKISFSYC